MGEKISFSISPADVKEAAKKFELLLEQGLISAASMSQKNSDVNVDGNIDIGVSVDGGGQVVVIVISVLAALIVILLIIYFSCKRGCVCCDNLCCNGRCHKSEREQKATEEHNKQLQQQLQVMNTQMRTMQAVQMQQMMQGSNQALAYTNQPISSMPDQFMKTPNRNQLSIGYNPQKAHVSSATPSPNVQRRNEQNRHKRDRSRAPNGRRNDKTKDTRYPDRVETPVATTGHDSRYIDV